MPVAERPPAPEGIPADLAGAVLPEYEGACVANLVPALAAPTPPAWLPAAVGRAERAVVLVLDGLGWNQLRERSSVAPLLNGLDGRPVTTVAPSTTATALTSITTGLPPAEHGVLGYRVWLGSEVMNVLRWRTPAGDAREAVPPASFQPRPPFGGARVAVVSRAEFAGTGFTAAHLRGARLSGWRLPSTLAVQVARLLADGERFVYAYYDGLDVVAHEFGFGPYYDAELAAVDDLVGDVLERLPGDTALVVTSDHGQVQVADRQVALDRDLLEGVVAVSGEGRFLWLHAKEGRAGEVEDRARQRFAASGEAWVVSRHEGVERVLFGCPLSPEVAGRIGDVALVARAPVAFVDPGDPGATRLVCRHGSLTADEVLVPLLAWAG